MPTVRRLEGVDPQGHRKDVGLVTQLNTNTGPHAHASQFYVDLSGLQRGLNDLANTAGDMYERYQRAKEQMWAQKTGIEMRKHWWKRFTEAEASGEPIDPAAFESEYEQHLAKAMDSAPSDRARLAAEMDLTEFGAGLFKQALQQTASARARLYYEDAMASFNELIPLMGNGADPNQVMDYIDQGVNALLPTLSEKQRARLEGVRQSAAQRRLEVTVTGEGPRAVAEKLRAGDQVGDHLDDAQKELTATSLDAKDRIDRYALSSMELKMAEETEETDPQRSAQMMESASLHRAEAIRQLDVSRIVDTAARLENFPGKPGQVMRKAWQMMLRKSLPGTMPTERMRLLAGIQENLGELSEAFQVAQAEVALINEQLNPASPAFDPVAVAMQNDWLASEVRRAQNEGNANEGSHAPRLAMEKLFAAQRIMGVPPGEERLFSKTERAYWQEQLKDADAMRKWVRNVQATLGDDLGGRAVYEVFAGKNKELAPALKLALLDPNNDRLWFAAKAGVKFEGADKNEALQKIEAHPAFRDFAASLAGVSPGDRVATVQEMREGIMQVAAFYAADVDKTGESISVGKAVSRAIEETIVKAFQFADMPNGYKIALPKEWLGDQVQPESMNLFLDTISNVIMHRDDVQVFSLAQDIPGEAMQQELKHQQFNLRTWVLEGDRLTLYFEGRDGLQPVRITSTKGGAPRKISLTREQIVKGIDAYQRSRAYYRQQARRGGESKPSPVRVYVDAFAKELFADVLEETQTPPVPVNQTQSLSNGANGTEAILQKKPSLDLRQDNRETSIQGDSSSPATSPKTLQRIGDTIINFEARLDKDGNLAVYDLPAGDGGGKREIAGINERYHPEMFKRLEAMKPAERKEAVRDYILKVTEEARAWNSNPGVQLFLADSAFNRGTAGAAMIVNMAFGLPYSKPKSNKPDAKALKALQELVERDPGAAISRLRKAREKYELSHVKQTNARKKFWNGLMNRWDKAEKAAMELIHDQSLATS